MGRRSVLLSRSDLAGISFAGLALAVGCCGGGAASEAPPARLPPASAIKGVWHRVSAGETVSDLAREHRVPAQDIEEINGLSRGEPLSEGQQVFVPGAEQTATVSSRGGQPGAPSASAPAASRPPALLWPVPGGRLFSKFGLRGKRPHEGIDIGAPEGTAVVAAGPGVVIYAGSGVRGYGNLILIHHPNGLVTVYAHNRKNLVAEKTRVQAGQVIAEVGQTGSATAPHLHFEVRQGESPKDPALYVHP